MGFFDEIVSEPVNETPDFDAMVDAAYERRRLLIAETPDSGRRGFRTRDLKLGKRPRRDRTGMKTG